MTVYISKVLHCFVLHNIILLAEKPAESSSWQGLRFAAAAEIPLRARERERLLLGIQPHFYNVSGISHSPSVNARKTWRLFS